MNYIFTRKGPKPVSSVGDVLEKMKSKNRKRKSDAYTLNLQVELVKIGTSERSVVIRDVRPNDSSNYASVRSRLFRQKEASKF